MVVLGLGGSCVLSFGIVDYYNKRYHGTKDDDSKLKKKAKANVKAKLEKDNKDKLKKQNFKNEANNEEDGSSGDSGDETYKKKK